MQKTGTTIFFDFPFFMTSTYNLAMEICPVDRPWIHTYVLEPYLEGCELVNQAWSGVDWSLERNHLSLTDRMIFWVQGIILMIPLINTIVWIAWQIFGKPEKMSAPFCPEMNLSLLTTTPPAPEIIIHPHTDGQEGDREQFGFIETVDNRPIRTSWLVETFPDVIVTTQNANEFNSSSVYRPDYSLKELHYQAGSKRIDLSMNNSSQVLVEISENEETTQQILNIPNDGRPWIQQRAIGLKPFVLSEAQEMEFYAVIPEYPTLASWVLSWMILKATPFIAKVKATKADQIENGLLKVEIASLDGWPYNRVKSELWFDPETGSLMKFIDSGTYISRKVGELVQNDPLPEQEHP